MPKKLPLAAQAVGRIDRRGRLRDSAGRVRQLGGSVQIDGRWHWRKEATTWSLLPNFLFKPTRVIDETLPLGFMGISFSAHGAWRISEANELEQHLELVALDGFSLDNWSEQESLAIEIEDAILGVGERLTPPPIAFQHPRLLFALGTQELLSSKIEEARQLFHDAYLRAHPDALEAEWHCMSLRFQRFREQFPAVCSQVDGGEPLRALNLLRNIVSQGHDAGKSLLAYCLRSSGENLEGIALCEELLRNDPLQSDIYGHLCSFLIQEHRDAEAQATAKQHVAHYPFESLAYKDLMESSLLAGDEQSALAAMYGYLCCSENSNLAARNVFTFFEEVGRLADARELLEMCVSHGRPATPLTRSLLAESILETGDLQAAETHFSQALAADPGSFDAVMGMARLLARKEELPEAEKFLRAVLHDSGRIDSSRQQLLVRTLLSQILRAQDMLEEAAELWAENHSPEVLREAGLPATLEAALALFLVGSPLANDLLGHLEQFREMSEVNQLFTQLHIDK